MKGFWHGAVLWMIGVTVALAADPPGYGPVGKETLWTVARQVNGQRHLGTTAQLAWALYRANPQAFEGGPDKIKPGAMLTVPDAATVSSIPSAEAYEKLTGKSAGAGAPVIAAALPSPPRRAAPASRPAAPRAVAPPAKLHEPPEILGIELQPPVAGKQRLGVLGANFRPGARVDMHDMLSGTNLNGQAPLKLADGRLELSAAVGKSVSNWLMVVRNSDGTRSEAFGFAAGPGATSVLPGPREAPAQVRQPPAAAAPEPGPEPGPGPTEDHAAEQEAIEAQLAAEKAAAGRALAEKAAADKAALDREFEEKMAADRAAYEKAEAGKARKAVQRR